MKALNSFLLLILAFSVTTCKKDVIEEDISDKSIIVNAPGSNLITTINSVTFWWDELSGAQKYTLQVVKPNFSQVAKLILDTNITKTKFTISLDPGVYQWRIKATNAGYETKFQVYDLKIDSTSDLTDQQVAMLSPANGTLTNMSQITFSWGKITAAKKYNLQVNNGLILDTIVTKTSLSYTLPVVANSTVAYTWNVKAINDQGESQYNSSPFSFTVDLKPPSAPSLVSPSGGSFVTNTVSLVWTRNNSADVAHDSVYVATDSLFTNVISQTWSEQATIKIVDLYNTPASNSTFYWWKVRSFDNVGNRSNFSAQLKFKLVP